MYQVAIVLNNTTANVSLTYRTKEKALAIWSELNDIETATFNIGDDYGYRLSLAKSSVAYVLFIDVATSQQADFDRQMFVNAEREKIGGKLEGMGFAPQTKRPVIIQ